jgi:heat shock protein HtpX
VWTWTGAERRVLRALGGHPADPARDARALNLIEGLSFTAGLRQPALLVLDSEGLNVAVAGRVASSAVVVATSSLLAELTRIELEGVLAAALVEIRGGELGPATVVASLPGLGRRLVSSAGGRDAATDLAAANLTRFPPGLASALDKMDSRGTAVAGAGPDQAHLWLADPMPAGGVTSARTALHDRAESLREL